MERDVLVLEGGNLVARPQKRNIQRREASIGRMRGMYTSIPQTLSARQYNANLVDMLPF